MIGKTIVFFIVFPVYCLTLTSCKEETVEPANDEHYRYFPLNTGFWTEYVVDSVVHLDIDDQTGLDTAIAFYHFLIREEVDTTFTDAVNETAYVIKRYRRDADTLPWQFMNIWTAKRTANSAQRVEDNLRFVRMQFPIDASALWNGNAYNYYPVEEYTYEDLYEQRSYNALQFPSTVTIVQNDFVSNINRVMKQEIYAKDIGLIFKQLDSIRVNPGSVIITNGLEYSQVITGYKQ